MNEGQPSRIERLAPQAVITLLLGIVAVYDYVCKDELMVSKEVDRLRESPATGKMTNWVLDTLYHHLKRNVPPEDDPIHRFATYFNKD